MVGLLREQPEEHNPQQPSWNCGACGNEWPCAHARADLIAESIAARTSVLVYLTMCLADAVAEFRRPDFGPTCTTGSSAGPAPISTEPEPPQRKEPTRDDAGRTVATDCGAAG
jgi:hypothetical protein